MANGIIYNWPVSTPNGIFVYPTFSAFPAIALNGTVALAADTDVLYAYSTGSNSWVPIAGPSSVLSIGTLDGQTPSANGAVINVNSLYMQSASATVPGLVNNTNQSFSGNKTFTGTISASNLSGTNTGNVTLGTANGLSLSGQILSLQLATTGLTGALSSTDWNTFNNKQATISIGALDAQTANANGLALVSNVLSTQSADATHPGLVNNTTQTLSGTKTFSSTPVVGTQSQGDSSTKAASTAYVDVAVANAVAGVNPAVAVQAATTSASDTSSFTYNNGVSGIGASLTGIVNTALTVDGYTFTTIGQRLLVKNDTQSPSGAFNGAYYVTQVQNAILPLILVRTLDFDTPSDINNTGSIPVINGTINGTTSWVLTSTINTIGTDPLTFTLFTKNPASYLLVSNNLSDVAVKATSFNNVSPVTSTGDLIVGNGANSNTRLAVGTQYQVLQANATTAAYDAVHLDQSAAVTGTLPVARGGTAVTSVTTAPTATAFAGWDANSNLSAVNFIEGYTTTATATTTTTLTVASTFSQFFTGSTTQTVKLPVTSTLVLGQQFTIVNNSSGAVTVQSSGSNTIQVMAANTQLITTCILTSGTGIASWSAAYSYSSGTLGTVTSVAMTVPAFLSISGSPITSSGTLAVSLSGTALPVANGGTGLVSGTSGGILGFTASGTIASSGTLTANQLIIGGGAGVTPSTLAAGSQYQVLTMGASVPGYGAVNLAQAAAITGALPIGNGGTGQITKAAAFDALSPMTTGGDLIYGGASGTGTRLANGTAGYVLTSAGTTLAPTWSAPNTGTVTSVAASGPSGIATWSSAVTSSGTLTQTLSTQTAGTFLAGPTSGSAATPTFRALTARTVQTFTSGSGTYTTPSGVLYLKVRLVGAGGGGGGGGTGGGSGGNGGNTTFSTLTGSGGALGNNNATGGAGGTGTNGDLNLSGGTGGNATSFTGSLGGVGGCSAFGGFGPGGPNTDFGRDAITNSGSGGGGAGAGSSVPSGSGGGAGGYVEKIISSPAATYSYGVGAAGSQGTAGTGGSHGGTGGSGLIIVEEYYQ